MNSHIGSSTENRENSSPIIHREASPAFGLQVIFGRVLQARTIKHWYTLRRKHVPNWNLRRHTGHFGVPQDPRNRIAPRYRGKKRALSIKNCTSCREELRCRTLLDSSKNRKDFLAVGLTSAVSVSSPRQTWRQYSSFVYFVLIQRQRERLRKIKHCKDE